MDADTAIAIRVRLESALRALTAALDVTKLCRDPDVPLAVSLSVLVKDAEAALIRTKRLHPPYAR
jgi:hypothetical protein